MKTLTKLMLYGFMLLAFTGSDLFAQSSARDNFNYGITGGLNFAKFRGNGVGSTDARTFGKFGLFAEYNVVDFFAIQPEVNYDVRGAKSKIADPRTRYRLSYIEVPVMFKGIYKNDSNVAPYISAGPSVAFKVSDKYQQIVGGVKTDGNIKDLGVKPNDTLFDMNFGAGVQLGYLNIGGRYSLGLSDLIKDTRSKNDTFSIILG
ncbi:MAG TPA: porin family protein, partial [Balneolaceae bacterium]|nr:porin family protein [Balneolaceae bacterium]